MFKNLFDTLHFCVFLYGFMTVKEREDLDLRGGLLLLNSPPGKARKEPS